MKNKEIQEKRIREYFIESTKAILKSEGFKNISVRNIADKAGYSYATLYNYFKDVNTLIFHCVKDFQDECKVFVNQKVENVPHGAERIKAITMAYMMYFVEYPSIFDLFYLTKAGEFCNTDVTSNLISKSLDNISDAEWNYCISHNLIKVEEVENIKSQLRLTVIGLLVLYLNRWTPSSYTDFINQANSQVDYILKADKIGVLPLKNDQSEPTVVQNSVISVKIL
jgi:AcrR family transcriptional regulator